MLFSKGRMRSQLLFLLVAQVLGNGFLSSQHSSWFLFPALVGCVAFIPVSVFWIDWSPSIRRRQSRIAYSRFRSKPPSTIATATAALHTNAGVPRGSATSVFDAKENANEVVSDIETVKSLTKAAIYGCGTEEGLTALRTLSELCDRRLPFDFDSFYGRQSTNDKTVTDSRDDDTAYSDKMKSYGSTILDKGERVISLLPKFLPEKSINNFLESVRVMEEQGWMSTNPDSVDGLPSLHLNLVSQGEPLYGSSFEDEDEYSFGNQIHKLYELVRPFVYETLLPEADRLLRTNDPIHNSTRTLRVSDVFLRRYGQDICGSVTRKGISIHYDVYSRITAVVALDEVASRGDNGLFTLEVNEETGETSNHKALRRFFPLATGDCVLHTWDVLHGVDVQEGLDRTSLIVWFDEEENENEREDPTTTTVTRKGDTSMTDENKNDSTLISPWLSLEHQGYSSTRTTLNDGNDVRQFVLASALASDSTDIERDETVANRLYLKSAARGNTFALTRMGSIFEEGDLSSSEELQNEAFEILEMLRPFDELPEILKDMLASQGDLNADDDDDSDGIAKQTELTCRFWFEGSLTGNPLAQKSLADEVMFMASRSGDPHQRLLAATLFALAAQQEEAEAGPSDSLARVIEYDVSAREVSSREEFLASPVVQTANAALTRK